MLWDYGQCTFTSLCLFSPVIHSLNSTRSVFLPWITRARVAHAAWTGAIQVPAAASSHTFPSVCTNGKMKWYGLTEDLFLSRCCQQVAIDQLYPYWLNGCWKDQDHKGPFVFHLLPVSAAAHSAYSSQMWAEMLLLLFLTLGPSSKNWQVL